MNAAANPTKDHTQYLLPPIDSGPTRKSNPNKRSPEKQRMLESPQGVKGLKRAEGRKSKIESRSIEFFDIQPDFDQEETSKAHTGTSNAEQHKHEKLNDIPKPDKVRYD